MYFVLFFISYINTSGFICTMETVKPLQDADDLFFVATSYKRRPEGNGGIV